MKTSTTMCGLGQWLKHNIYKILSGISQSLAYSISSNTSHRARQVQFKPIDQFLLPSSIYYGTKYKNMTKNTLLCYDLVSYSDHIWAKAQFFSHIYTYAPRHTHTCIHMPTSIHINIDVETWTHAEDLIKIWEEPKTNRNLASKSETSYKPINDKDSVSNILLTSNLPWQIVKFVAIIYYYH
jgi:hypothetical protein